jgi:hypothetical protein
MIRPCLPEVTGPAGDLYAAIAGPSHRFAPWPLRSGVVGQGHALPGPGGIAVTPDHYLLRMLYSLGVPMEDLGVGCTR